MIQSFMSNLLLACTSCGTESHIASGLRCQDAHERDDTAMEMAKLWLRFAQARLDCTWAGPSQTALLWSSLWPLLLVSSHSLSHVVACYLLGPKPQAAQDVMYHQ